MNCTHNFSVTHTQTHLFKHGQIVIDSAHMKNCKRWMINVIYCASFIMSPALFPLIHLRWIISSIPNLWAVSNSCFYNFFPSLQLFPKSVSLLSSQIGIFTPRLNTTQYSLSSMCSCPRKNIIWTEDPVSTIASAFKTWKIHLWVEGTAPLRKGSQSQSIQVTELDENTVVT